MGSEKKFRPSFTLAQLNYIQQLVEADQNAVTDSMKWQMLQYLKLFKTKIDLGAMEAAYSAGIKRTTEEKLGMVDPVEQRRAAYIKWEINPAICTAEEVRMAKTHMYENDMMTPSEEAEYEESL